MKCSLDISNFLAVISSLSHSIVFLYFFALIAEEGFLISLAILWNSVFRWVYISFLFCFLLLFFSQLFVRPPQTAFLVFCISFSWGCLDPCLLYSIMKLHLQFIRHSVYQLQSLKSISHFHCIQFKSEFCNKEFMQSASGPVFADCIELLHLWLQRI